MYMIEHHNRRGVRYKLVDTLDEAKRFKKNCSDPHAIVWHKIILDK